MLVSIIIFNISDIIKAEFKVDITTQYPIILMHERQTSFFFDKTTKEITVFMSRELIKRTPNRERIVIEDKGYIGHSMRINDLGIVVITKVGYPQRVAFRLALECLNCYRKSEYYITNTSKTTDCNIELESIHKLFKDYQNPNTVLKNDKIFKINNELDMVKEIMVQNIEDLLNRGTKIEDLVNKTQDLSDTSKTFVRKTKEMNRCCIIL